MSRPSRAPGPTSSLRIWRRAPHPPHAPGDPRGGAKAGLALNPGTPVEAVEYLLDLTDLICVMTVNPGFGGQKFIHSQVAKVRRLREMIGDRPVHIEIDGGVTTETAPLVAKAGADVLVAGSAVFKGGSVRDPAPYGANIRAIREAAASVLAPA